MGYSKTILLLGLALAVVLLVSSHVSARDLAEAAQTQSGEVDADHYYGKGYKFGHGHGYGYGHGKGKWKGYGHGHYGKPGYGGHPPHGTTSETQTQQLKTEDGN